MEVIVTGGTGFVGSHLVNELAERGHDVTAADLDTSETAVDIPDKVEREELDVTRSGTLDFQGFDAVVHLVALSPVSRPRKVSYEDVHVGGTANVVREAEDSGVKRMVHMSALGADPEGETEYLRTKGEAEKKVRDSGLEYRIFRPSVIFGEGDEFLSFFREAVMKSAVVPLPGAGRNRFQPVYVKDVARLLRIAVEGGLEKDTYEVGGPRPVTMREVVEMAGRAEGREPFILPVPMSLVFLGLLFMGSFPASPVGLDQYRSLKMDNVPDRNDAAEELDFMKSLSRYVEQ